MVDLTGGPGEGPLRLPRPTLAIPQEPEDESVDFRRIWRGLWRRKWLILGFSLLMASLFFTISARQQRIFVAQTTVLLDPREQHVMGRQDQVVSDLELSTPIIESEMALLRARSLVEDVVLHLGADRFEAFDPANRPPGFVDRLTGAAALLQRADAAGTPAVLSEDDQRLGRIVRSLQRTIAVRRVGESYAIDISVALANPRLAHDVANAVADKYIAAQLADRQRVAENATRWLAEQVTELRASLDTAEAAVERFKRDSLARSGTSESVLEEQVSELSAQLAAARSERASALARLDQLTASVDAEGARAAADIVASPFIDALRGERSLLARQAATLARTLGPNHPDRQSVTTALGDLDAAIAQEVANLTARYRNDISVLASREETLRSDIAMLETQLSDRATGALRLRQLERDAQAARERYQSVRARLGETRAQVEIQRAEAKLVTPADIPENPASPKVALLTAFGGALGLTTGLVAAVLLELLKTSFSTGRDVQRATGLTLLGAIPRTRIKRPAQALEMLEDKTYSPFVEQIRHLRIAVSTLLPQTAPQSVLLLSAVPDEGKTTTALALAGSFAKAGLRTIYVDMDISRSAFAAHVQQAPSLDILDVMRGKADLSEVTSAPTSSGLVVTGVRRRRSTLSESVRPAAIKAVIEDMKKHYDRIVIDAPPLLSQADSLVLAGASDSVLFVVRCRSTPAKSVSHGIGLLRNIGIKAAGVVLTMTEAADDPATHPKAYAA